MKSLMFLLQCLLADASRWCRTCTTRDFERITRRVEHEGLSFLTITLPSFAKDFERSLDQGYVTPSMFGSFSKRGSLPRLFGGLTELVFDRVSGRLLDEPDVTAIFFVRQLCCFYKKILLPCSKERERSAYVKYIECENEVSAWTAAHRENSDTVREFARMCDLLWGPDLSDLDLKVHVGGLRPRHGPGATADKLYGNAKFDQQTWHTRLEEFFPCGEYLIPNGGFFDRLDRVDFVEPETEMPVKVITVPKTLKTPRIIAIEPTCMQYAQQAILRELVSALERSSYLANSLGFTDQVPNQVLAREGSYNPGSFATLDMSDASDRVSNLLVCTLLRRFPHLAGAVAACRSTRADVPGFGIITLSKFASMGSALCFPFEAMVFLTIVALGIEKTLNRSVKNGRELSSLLSRVRIYGDDIIVPVEYVQSVVNTLDAFCMKVNTAKSFWTGNFRESCGKDYYAGSDVTVTYCRRMLPTSRRDVSEILSAVSLRNQLYKAGCWETTAWLDQYLRRLAPLPTVLDTSPVVGRHSFLGFETQRECDKLHRPLVKGMVVVAKARSSKLDDSGALLKFFLKDGSEPIFDVKHLERYGRPDSVDIKIRWAPST